MAEIINSEGKGNFNGNEPEKPNQVVARCPGCGKKFRQEDMNKLFIAIQIGIFLNATDIAPTVPALICLNRPRPDEPCGSVFFPKFSVLKIIDQLSTGKRKIILPKQFVEGKRIEINRKDRH